MDQHLRHQYLETLGITSWLPRQQPVAARPTPDWVWDYCWPESEASNPQALGSNSPAIASAADTAEAAKQARAALNASFSAPTEAKPTPAPVNPLTERPTVAAPEIVTEAKRAPVEPVADIDTPVETVEVSLPDPSAATEQAPFKLAFMSFADCLVVDALPPRSRQGNTQADVHHQILLEKILRSIGLQGGEPLEYFILPWPMFASRSLDQGREQAQLTVQHKLNKTLKQRPVNTVLLLGEAAAQMVLAREEPLDQLRGMLFSLRSDTKTLASASLTEMMTLPGCKREVWSDLQPLLDHLEKTHA